MSEISEIYEEAKKHPGLFIEFPVNMDDRLIVLNPEFINPDIKDALVRFVQGDEITEAMLANRSFFENCLNTDGQDIGLSMAITEVKKHIERVGKSLDNDTYLTLASILNELSYQRKVLENE